MALLTQVGTTVSTGVGQAQAIATDALFGDDATAGQGGSGGAKGEGRVTDPRLLPTSVSYGILDHDLVLWVGDLNYALFEDQVEAAAARAMLAGDAEGTLVGHGEVPRELKVADQLNEQKKEGRAFTGFEEVS